MSVRSERDLCKVLSVGRSTLREAMRALEALGLVHVMPGQGTFLVRSFLDLLRETRQTLWQSPERPGLSVRQHRQILAGIDAHDPRAAERTTREHVRGARQFVLLAKQRQPPG